MFSRPQLEIRVRSCLQIHIHNLRGKFRHKYVHLYLLPVKVSKGRAYPLEYRHVGKDRVDCQAVTFVSFV
jgi:hypothetical protein